MISRHVDSKLKRSRTVRRSRFGDGTFRRWWSQMFYAKKMCFWNTLKVRLSGVRRKFSWGGFIQWHMVVICICCALFVTSQFDVIVMFPNQRFGEVFWHNMHIFLHPLPLFYVCHCTEYKLLVLQVRLSEENTLNATTQQFITAKISGCALKQGSKTHSSMRQSDLQLQNAAALMSYRIWAVEHTKSAAGLAGAHPGLKDRILLNYTRIENAHKVRKKTFDFLLFIEMQQIFCFPFCLLRHYEMPECFYVNNCCFWACAAVLSCYRNW